MFGDHVLLSVRIRLLSPIVYIYYYEARETLETCLDIDVRANGLYVG